MLALALAGVGAERVVAARAAEEERDTAYAALTAGGPDDLHETIVVKDDARARAEVVGLSLLGGAAAAGVWSIIEWLVGEPGIGQLETRGVDLVEAP